MQRVPKQVSNIISYNFTLSPSSSPYNLNPKQVSNILSYNFIALPVVLRAQLLHPNVFRVSIASANVVRFLSMLGRVRLGAMELQLHAEEADADNTTGRLDKLQ
jgi:hypothetical protein